MPKKEKTKKAETDADSQDYVAQLAAAAEQNKENGGWVDADYSGQLAVDVYEDDQNNIIIRAAIAGVRAEDIDITVNDDVVTIKGMRRIEDEETVGNYLYQECYWGGFSRTIILPTEVDADQINATLRSGILRITLPKITKAESAPITVVDQDEEGDE